MTQASVGRGARWCAHDRCASGHFFTDKKEQTPPRHPHYAVVQFSTMNSKELLRLGVPQGEALKAAHDFIQAYIEQGNPGAELQDEITRIVAEPTAFFEDAL